jgi:hypothetical protein
MDSNVYQNFLREIINPNYPSIIYIIIITTPNVYQNYLMEIIDWNF